MPLCRLIFSTRAVDEHPPHTTLHAFSRSVDVRHTRYALTGCIIAIGDWYLHYVEGRRPYVNACWRESVADKRHTAAMLVDFREIDERLFRGWGAENLSARALNELAERFLLGNSFDPGAYSARTYDLLFARVAARLETLQESTLEVEFIYDPGESPLEHWQSR
jgi:hypothetical protein